MRDCILAAIGSGKLIYELRKKIQQSQIDLEQLGSPPVDIPEMIESSNLRRTNEYLSKANEKKTELLINYEKHSQALEELLSTILDIQKDLKEILKEQSLMISNSPKKQSKPKTKRK